MKDYFLRLFNYDLYANLLLADIILKAGNPQQPVQLMAHLITAQSVWLKRCKRLPPYSGPLWPNGDPNLFSELLQENNNEWIDFINELKQDDFEHTVAYHNSKGEQFQNRLSDILAHAINHGTHHRAQIGQLLKAGGVESLPITDYIFYIRSI